ncbi:hypothetical protein HYH02_005474 [Chlamydomonas schloesseri]|uniref:S1 motif domain-containing protein n=1 Tax=Chlamydomonas schloesseri TaxID=2026947 RepID=A0A836B767_9CHLO|nr:hypothetical protein HYH02_005474 [Chlamydomonas schloesseri]|eukprot:KAG2449319.1 hypothetical protein HYH02_005474 [Chlamydomonas schloesseri]
MRCGALPCAASGRAWGCAAPPVAAVAVAYRRQRAATLRAAAATARGGGEWRQRQPSKPRFQAGGPVAARAAPRTLRFSAPAPKTLVEGVVDSVQPFGVFVRLVGQPPQPAERHQHHSLSMAEGQAVAAAAAGEPKPPPQSEPAGCAGSSSGGQKGSAAPASAPAVVALLHMTEVTRCTDVAAPSPASVFEVGQALRAVVLHVVDAPNAATATRSSCSTSSGSTHPAFVYLSTKVLEMLPGDMLVDPRRVYDKAPETAEAWRRGLTVQQEEEEQQEEAAASPPEFINMRGSGGSHGSHTGGAVVQCTVVGVDALKGVRVVIDAGGGGGGGDGGVAAWIAPCEVTTACDDGVPAEERLGLFKEGDKVKALVVGAETAKSGGPQLSTARIERFAGQMLTDAKGVYKHAHASAAIWAAHRQPVHLVLSALKDVKAGSVVEGVALAVNSYGVKFEMANGFRAWIPRHEMASEGGSSSGGGGGGGGALQPGDPVRAVVKGVQRGTYRLFLTTKPTAAGGGRDDDDTDAQAAQLESMVGKVVHGHVAKVLHSGVAVRLQTPRPAAYGSSGSSGSGHHRGLKGLLPATQISQERVRHPGEVFKLGQPVRALVTSVDYHSYSGHGQLLLSTKALEDSPGDMLRGPKAAAGPKGMESDGGSSDEGDLELAV